MDRIHEDEQTQFWLEKVNAASGELSRQLHVCIQNGMTEDDIAARLGVSPVYLGYAFGAPLDMNIRHLSDLALAMGCDLEIKLVPFSEKDPK